MTQDHFEIGIGVEQPGEDQPEEMRAGIHREAPGGHGKLAIALKVGLEHVGMRDRRVQINWYLQRLGTFEDRPVLSVIEKLSANVTIDHRALEAELGNGSLKLFRRHNGVARWE